MRRLVLLVTVAASLAATVTASAVVYKLAPARCISSTPVVNTTAGTASATGKCTVAGKTVSSVLSYNYNLYDGPDFKYACSPVKGRVKSGQSFKLQPAGGYAVDVTVKVAPSKGLPGKLATKTLKHQVMGGNLLQCGKPVNLPDPSQICTNLADGVNCGVPFPEKNFGCAFTSGITFSDNTFRVGHVSCQWGTCWFSNQAASTLAGTPFPAMTRFGIQQEQEYQLHCWQTQNWGYVGIEGLAMTAPDGEMCQWYPSNHNRHAGAATTMKIPADWGGSIVAIGGVDIEFTADSRFHRGQEWESSAFKLGGTQNGCAQLTATPTG